MAKLSSLVFLLLEVSIIYATLFAARTFAQTDKLKLDDNFRRLALRLMKEFTNKTRLAELIANGDKSLHGLETIPAQPLASIYRNYTYEQIDALEAELRTHSHYIYEPLAEKSADIRHDFDRACQSYDANHDLPKFEIEFLNTGKQLVAVQKMVLRIINSRLESKLNDTRTIITVANRRTRRNLIAQTFDRLSYLLLSGVDATWLYKASRIDVGNSSSVAQISIRSVVNQMYALMRSIAGAERNTATHERVEPLRALLARLQSIFRLNRIASTRHARLNTEFISPFNYQALLHLTQTLGAATSAAQSLQQLTQTPLNWLLRSWINLLNGGNMFTMLTRPSPGDNGNTDTKRMPKYDPRVIQALMEQLQQNEKNRQQQIEMNRQREMLEALLRRQQRQQEQITEILNGLSAMQQNFNRTTTTTMSTTTMRTTTTTMRTMTTSATTTTTSRPMITPTRSSSGSGSGNMNMVLLQLKEQRRHLKDLLNELEKNPVSSVSGEAGSTHNQQPTKSSNAPTSNDLMQAQQSLMTIMKNITPMINSMAQIGAISRPRLQKSKYQLLDILNSANNRETIDDDDAEIEDRRRVGQLAQKLDSVLHVIIAEANENSKTPDADKLI